MSDLDTPTGVSTTQRRLIVRTTKPSPPRWVALILAVFACGMTMLVAAGQVYFRDIKNFLPYATRVWLYSTPILYYASEVPDRYDWILTINPLAPIISSWSRVIDTGRAPELDAMLLAVAWAVGVFLVAAVFFVSREREFAVRL